MTEHKIENAMEHFGNSIENTFEGAATVFDKSMNLAWSYRPVRCVGKTLAFLTGAGLVAKSISFKEKGYDKAAKVCLISGSVVIVAGITELIFIRRK